MGLGITLVGGGFTGLAALVTNACNEGNLQNAKLRQQNAVAEGEEHAMGQNVAQLQHLGALLEAAQNFPGQARYQDALNAAIQQQPDVIIRHHLHLAAQEHNPQAHYALARELEAQNGNINEIRTHYKEILYRCGLNGGGAVHGRRAAMALFRSDKRPDQEIIPINGDNPQRILKQASHTDRNNQPIAETGTAQAKVGHSYWQNGGGRFFKIRDPHLADYFFREAAAKQNQDAITWVHHHADQEWVGAYHHPIN